MKNVYSTCLYASLAVCLIKQYRFLFLPSCKQTWPCISLSPSCSLPDVHYSRPADCKHAALARAKKNLIILKTIVMAFKYSLFAHIDSCRVALLFGLLSDSSKCQFW